MMDLLLNFIVEKLRLMYNNFLQIFFNFCLKVLKIWTNYESNLMLSIIHINWFYLFFDIIN